MAAVIAQRLARVPWRAVAVLPLLALSALAPADSDRRPRLNRRIVKVALRGLGREGYLRLVERVVPQLAGKADAATIAYGAEATGRVIVVTATDGVLAQRFLATTALAGVEIIGSSLTFEPNGRVRFARHTVGREKVAALRRAGVDVSRATFLTDSASDLPLLREVRRGFLVRPSGRTCRAVAVAGVAVDIWP